MKCPVSMLPGAGGSSVALLFVLGVLVAYAAAVNARIPKSPSQKQ